MRNGLEIEAIASRAPSRYRSLSRVTSSPALTASSKALFLITRSNNSHSQSPVMRERWPRILY
jgi:hypothetical protein